MAVEIQFSTKWSCDLFQFGPGGQFERIGDPFAIEVVDQLRWNLPGFCQAGESFVGLDNVGLRSEVMFAGINYLACERIEPLVKRGLIKQFQFRIVELAGEFPQGLTHLPGSNQLPGGLQRIFQGREWCGSASQAYGTGWRLGRDSSCFALRPVWGIGCIGSAWETERRRRGLGEFRFGCGGRVRA